MAFYPFLQPLLLGLDIQAGGIFFVKLKRKGQAYHLERSGKMTIDGSIFSEDRVINWEYLGIQLTDFVLKHGLNGLKTAISVPSSLVRMQVIELPEGLTEAAMEAEIYLQLQRDLPGMRDVLHIDYTVLSRRAGVGEVLFAAVRQGYLSQFIDCVDAAGLRVKKVDVDVLALKRAIKTQFNTLHTETQTVLAALNQAEFLQAYGLAMCEAPPW